MQHTISRPAVYLRQPRRLGASLATLWRQLRQTFDHWRAVKAQRLGAALAYYTIFSLAPLLVIAILIAGGVFGQTAAREQIVGQISYLMGPQGAAGVASLLEQQSIPGQSGVLPTIISLVTLLVGAVGLFGQLEDAFDTVWEVKPPPTKGIWGAIKERILPFGMVLVVAFLLLVALVVNAAVSAISAQLGPSIPFFGLVSAAINLLLPLAVTTVLFAALFHSVPHENSTWRELWPGAFMTAVLFTLGKIAIGVYLGHSSLASASGATGSLLVVLVWVYYTAQILLFGAVFTHIYTVNRRDHNQPQTAPKAAPDSKTTAAANRSEWWTRQPLWSGPPAARLSASDAPRPGCLGALLAFAAGLGAGVLVALRRRRRSGPTP